MKLTKQYTDGTFGVADELPCGENSHEFKHLVISKLGEYESLGTVEDFKTALNIMKWTIERN